MPRLDLPHPTQVYFGPEALAEGLGELHDLPVLLICSQGAKQRGLLKQLQKYLKNIVHIVNDVPAQVGLEYLMDQHSKLQNFKYAAIIAAGGGSVLDAAKALSLKLSADSSLKTAICQPTSPEIEHHPLIAVPTTAGTGSDLTPWATIWDYKELKKYSLFYSNLFPVASCIDPALTLTANRQLTCQTALDAFSHCLESIWNKRRDQVSLNYAIAAAGIIYSTLPALLDDLESLHLRSEISEAVLGASVALSRTSTAVAHAISYYFTLRHDLVHGLACSFTLPAIVASVCEDDETCKKTFTRLFGSDPAAALETFFAKLSVSTRAEDYAYSTSEQAALLDSVRQSDRSANYSGDLDKLLKKLFN